MPEPELRDDDVLVRVHAAGVNLLDSKFRNGEASAAFFSFFALEPTRR
jgi:NADPH:quinone reductase-like Zn-dependent oxidoreductase